MIEKQDGDNGVLPGTVVDTIYKYTQGTWEEVPTKLMKPRQNFECVLSGDNIFIFCGNAGDGKPPTTMIEIFNVKTYQIKSAEFRLPLGVSGCSLAWHGDDVLLVGGNRCGSEEGSTAVMKLDFKEKNILSLRDLGTKRASAIIIPIEHDKIIAVAGAKHETSIEERSWNHELFDYVWKDCTNKVKGDISEIMQKPTEYNAVLTTFCVSASIDDNFPALSTTSSFIFGNELSPFLMEFTEAMEVNFYPAPMRLQQKTGQVAYRFSKNIMYFIGGTDTTYTFYSKKVFKLNISRKSVDQVSNMSVGKAGFCIAEFKVSIIYFSYFSYTVQDKLFVFGGYTKGREFLNTGEYLSLSNDKGGWTQTAPMSVARAGAFTWSDPKNNKIYVAGGAGADNQPLNTVEVYDVEQNSWSQAGKL